jgi:hypothetical protein
MQSPHRPNDGPSDDDLLTAKPRLLIPADRERSFRSIVNTDSEPMLNTDSGYHERRFRPW